MVMRWVLGAATLALLFVLLTAAVLIYGWWDTLNPFSTPDFFDIFGIDGPGSYCVNSIGDYVPIEIGC